MHYIYIYYHDNTPIYVGETNNVIRRHNEHLHNSSWFSRCDRIRFARVADENIAKIYESFLIALNWKTIFNEQSPNLYVKYNGHISLELELLKWCDVSIGDLNKFNFSTRKGVEEFAIQCTRKGMCEVNDRLFEMAMQLYNEIK